MNKKSYHLIMGLSFLVIGYYLFSNLLSNQYRDDDSSKIISQPKTVEHISQNLKSKQDLITSPDRITPIPNEIANTWNIRSKAVKNLPTYEFLQAIKAAKSSQYIHEADEHIFFQINQESYAQFYEDRPDAFILKMKDVAGKDMEVQLYRNNILSEDMQLFDGDQLNKSIDVGIQYFGLVNGQEETTAALSFFENEMGGALSATNGGYNNLVVNKLGEQEVNEAEPFLLYNDKDIHNRISPFECHVEDKATNYHLSRNNGATARNSAARPECIRVFLDIGNDIRIAKGGTEGATRYAINFFNTTVVGYYKGGLPLKISGMQIWTSDQAWDGFTNNTPPRLDAYNAYRQSTGLNGHHFYHLLNQQGGGGLAYVGFLCTGSNFTAVSGVNNNDYPFWALNANIFGHEMGHQVGLSHSDACIHNGDNTYLLACATRTACVGPNSTIIPANEPGYWMAHCAGLRREHHPIEWNIINNTLAARNCTCNNQLKFTPDYVVEGCYNLKFKHSGKTAILQSGDTNNSPVVQSSNSGLVSFELVLKNSTTNEYALQTTAGLVLQIENGATTNAARLVASTDNGQDHQRWYLQNATDFGTGGQASEPKYFYIVNKKSELYLDVEFLSTADNAAIAQYPSNRNDNQKIELVSAPCSEIGIDLFNECSEEFLFDFGTPTSPVFPNYAQVTENTQNDLYGWLDNSGIGSGDRGTDANTNDINRDFCLATSPKTFETKLSNGLWRVTINSGDRQDPKDGFYVTAEGEEKITNYNSAAGVYTTQSFEIEVTDGALTLEFDDRAGGDERWVINRVKLNRIGDAGIGLYTSSSTVFQLDLGPYCSPVFPDYAQLTETTQTALYGWTNTSNLNSGDRGTNGTTNDINRDFVWSSAPATFEATVSDGIWRVTLNLGDRDFARDGMYVTAEGTAYIQNLNTAASSYPTQVFDVPVSDGKLTLDFDDRAGNPDWTLTRIKYEKIDELCTTIGQACDDGDICTTGEMYDDDCNCVGGIFQDSDNDGLCDANDNTTGDCTLGTPCDDGDVCTIGETLDANCNCIGGTFQDSDNNGICDVYDFFDECSEEFLFDFGTPTSPVFPNYAQVTENTQNDLYGWLDNSGIGSGDRGTDANTNDINRDFCLATSPKTFETKLSNGLWRVTINSGDRQAPKDGFYVTAEGEEKISNYNSAAGNYTTQTFDIEVTDGALTLEFDDRAGGDERWVINRVKLNRIGDAGIGLYTADSEVFQFDFGTTCSPVFPDYAQVTEKTQNEVYGWLDTNDLFSADKGPISGVNDINRDYVLSTSARTFETQLANGLWRITLNLGDPTEARDGMYVVAEGEEKIQNLNTAAGETPTQVFDIVVTDGALTLVFDNRLGTNPTWSLTRVKLEKLEALCNLPKPSLMKN